MTTLFRLRWETFTWCPQSWLCSPTSPGGPGWWGWWAAWSAQPRWSAWAWRASLPVRGETSGWWRAPGSWPWLPAWPGLPWIRLMLVLFMSYNVGVQMRITHSMLTLQTIFSWRQMCFIWKVKPRQKSYINLPISFAPIGMITDPWNLPNIRSSFIRLLHR